MNIDPKHLTATNSSTTSAMSLEEMMKFAEEFKKKDRELLRGESLMIEQMECPTCKRKPTVTRGTWGKAYVVCKHIMEAIERQIPKAEPPARTAEGLPPLGWSPYGVHIEVLDDGPRRW